MDCIWCGEPIAPDNTFVTDGDDQFHTDCFEKYIQAIDQLKHVYQNPEDDLEVFIDGGSETRH